MPTDWEVVVPGFPANSVVVIPKAYSPSSRYGALIFRTGARDAPDVLQAFSPNGYYRCDWKDDAGWIVQPTGGPDPNNKSITVTADEAVINDDGTLLFAVKSTPKFVAFFPPGGYVWTRWLGGPHTWVR
jgi:hypothetical protein